MVIRGRAMVSHWPGPSRMLSIALSPFMASRIGGVVFAAFRVSRRSNLMSCKLKMEARLLMNCWRTTSASGLARGR